MHRLLAVVSASIEVAAATLRTTAHTVHFLPPNLSHAGTFLPPPPSDASSLPLPDVPFALPVSAGALMSNVTGAELLKVDKCWPDEPNVVALFASKRE